MVRTRPIDYLGWRWRFHRAISYAWWFGVAGYVAGRQIRGMWLHTWPVPYGVTVLVCLACLLRPPHEAHHWITYRRFVWWLAPLNVPLWIVGVVPVSPRVNEWEMRLRHRWHFRSELPGTLIALPVIGLAPVWIVVGLALVIGHA